MRHAADESSKRTDPSRRPAEEYELESVRRVADEPPAEPAFDDAPAANASPVENSVNQRGWKKWLSRQPHIHYVPLNAARDHFANERVFLAYVRTGMAFANSAILILQLYRLKHNPSPGKLSDYDLGIPLAAVTLVIAIAIIIAGSWRFFACQNAMATKKQIVTCGLIVVIFTPVIVLWSLVLLIFTIVVNPNV